MQFHHALLLALAYLLFNVVTFCFYAWDKRAAIKSEQRISENTLLGLALLGGSVGAVAAQRILRHKTRKEPFRSILLTIVVLHIGLAAFWLVAPTGIVPAVLHTLAGR